MLFLTPDLENVNVADHVVKTKKGVNPVKNAFGQSKSLSKFNQNFKKIKYFIHGSFLIQIERTCT